MYKETHVQGNSCTRKLMYKETHVQGNSCTRKLMVPPWTSFFVEEWVWDFQSRSPNVYLCYHNKVACFHIDPVVESTGTAAVLGNKAFAHGQHYWEIKLTDVRGTSMMIGVATQDAMLHTDNYEYVNLVGRDQESWGLSHRGEIWHGGQKWKFCEPFFDSTVIGVLLDMDKGTISFFKNGQPLGVAFTGLQDRGCELYPIASSTASESEVELGYRCCKYSTLIDQCCMEIIKHVNRDNMNRLPLPGRICNLLKSK
ncbi:SPRY domain-containing SOCS box protein 3 isoform X1 [Nematostella vectensis]|uniref:SPRY domain-containing SOCS box protein 3 isoform X1 n=2 Tax=Nematostella vectensis TaxID=45351 RepID=UPI00138F9F05|nr:SPRY domain-containing SOCS box protein 3 isoform X1 [Nematostella vectensis]